MSLTLWLSLVAICMLGAMSPGPSLAVVLRHSIVNSTRHGLMVAVAHGLGVGVYALITVLGLASIMLSSELLYKGLVYSGAIYLLYMGIKALMAKGGAFELDTDQQQVTSLSQAAMDGFLIAFLNPKLAVFFVALFSQFIDPNNITWLNSIIMVTTVLLIDTIWYCVVAVLVHNTRERFTLVDKGPLIDKIAGVVFIVLSVRVVTL